VRRDDGRRRDERIGRRDERSPGSRAGMTAQIKSASTAEASGAPPMSRSRGPSARDGFWPWLFLAPLLLGMGAFYLWPIVQTFINTFMSIGPFGGGEFAGLANYRKLLTEPDFLRSVRSEEHTSELQSRFDVVCRLL